jgi:predicted TIM-barrel fold metal-dependent hydrolase
MNYEIWEYGEKENVRYSQSDGTVNSLLQAMEEAGAEKAFITHMFNPINIPGLISSEYGLKKKEISDEYERAFWSELLKASNIWVCKIYQNHPELLPFIHFDPHIFKTEEAVAHLQELYEVYDFKGIKVHPTSQQFYLYDERMMPVWKTCTEYNLSVIAHSGPSRGETQHGAPKYFKKVLTTFPDLKIVLAHMGGGEWSKIDALREHKNAYFDVSEIIEWTGSQYGPTEGELGKLVKKLGPEKVLMGSDFPWYDIDHTVERVMELPHLKKDEKERILGENAEVFLET